MKKRIYLLLSLGLCMAMLAGCGSTTATASESTDTTTEDATEATTEAEESSDTAQAPAAGMEQDKGVMGKVTAVDGDSITVVLADT